MTPKSPRPAMKRTRHIRSVKTLDEILVELRALKPILREKYGVKEMWVFGSYVHGTAKKKSDLDILVDIDMRPFTLFTYMELECFLGDIVGIKVDLVQKEALKPLIRPDILDSCVSV